MLNFEYTQPTKFVFGKGAEMHAGEELKKLGGTRALIHFGGGSAVKSGLIARVEKSLEDAGISYVELGGAVPNPRDTKVYEGMVVGVCPKQEDVVVNVCRRKQLTNMRAAGSDEALRLVPPRRLSLEQCLEFLADDELLEVTPESLRIRKTILNHEKRMKAIHKKK